VLYVLLPGRLGTLAAQPLKTKGGKDVLAKGRGLLVPLGLLCLSLAVLVGRAGSGVWPRADFLEGLLVGIAAGLSVVAVLTQLVVYWNEREDTE
jgi:hypothetical protein